MITKEERQRRSAAMTRCEGCGNTARRDQRLCWSCQEVEDAAQARRDLVAQAEAAIENVADARTKDALEAMMRLIETAKA